MDNTIYFLVDDYGFYKNSFSNRFDAEEYASENDLYITTDITEVMFEEEIEDIEF